MPYATKTDVSEFTGINSVDLPGDTERMINRSDELLDHATLSGIDTTKTTHAEVAKAATCAQVEYWLKGVGEETDVTGSVKNYSVGSFSVDYGGRMPTLAPRAKRILFNAGLLNRGVKRV